MDLIPRMLIVDPMKRITIREIRDHPWFQNRLPLYLAVPPPNTAQQAKMVPHLFHISSDYHICTIKLFSLYPLTYIGFLMDDRKIKNNNIFVKCSLLWV